MLYVPIGQGSGICGCILARDLLGLKTEIVGVQSTEAPSYALSFAAGKVVTDRTPAIRAPTAWRRACPMPRRLAIIRKGASRIVQVTDDEIAAADPRLLDRHPQSRRRRGRGPARRGPAGKGTNRGKRVGLILTGGNIDFDLFHKWIAQEVIASTGARAMV